MKIIWKYSPKKFIEEKYSVHKNRFQITFENGKAICKIDQELYKNNPNTLNLVEEIVKCTLDGVRLETFRDYSLEISKIKYDNAKNWSDVIQLLTLKTSFAANVDLIQRDSSGKIVLDTRKERINAQSELSMLVLSVKNEDLLFEKLLQYWESAVKNPENEFSHLYDIRDALKKHFSGKENLCTKLKISSNEYGDLGRIANNEPLTQGRHKGENIGNLRPATESEKTTIRKIARKMIVNYGNYLVENNPTINDSD